MSIVTWLKREGFGAYDSVDQYVGELARRSTSALGGLGTILSSPSHKHLVAIAEGPGQAVCADLVRDLRVPKGARIGALRALLMAGTGAQLARVFAGAFDLFDDYRIPDADKPYLCKDGLKAFLDAIPGDTLNLELARGAAAVETAVKVVGKEAIDEILSKYPANHVPAMTLRHVAVDAVLAPGLEDRWVEVLGRQFRAAKNAPAAARRLGRAPEWPPVVPEKLRHLLDKAEEAPATAAATKAGKGADSRVMPAMRARGLRGTGEAASDAADAPSDQFITDEIQVDPDATRTGPRRSLQDTPLANLRFGEQVELLATRGTRAIERFIAVFDVRVGYVGVDKTLAEVERAAKRRGHEDVNAPMLDELMELAVSARAPSPWRKAARAVLAHLAPDRAAALKMIEPPPEPGRSRMGTRV